MAENTGGVAVAEKTATEPGAEKNPTPNPGEKGVEGRIAELIAERNRKDEKIARLEKERGELLEKHKTEQEKALDALVNERISPIQSELEQHREYLKGELKGLLDEIPAEHHGAVLTGENIPLYQQVAQARSVLALLGKQKPSPIPGAGKPGSVPKPEYSRQEYEAWMRLASSAATLAQYNERREEMLAARREGRVKGI